MGWFKVVGLGQERELTLPRRVNAVLALLPFP
jgi:hypothetical protein